MYACAKEAFCAFGKRRKGKVADGVATTYVKEHNKHYLSAICVAIKDR
jgi:hypothetical protein